MTKDEYEKLLAADQDRFMECPDCGEILSLEELLLHVAHKHRGFDSSNATRSKVNATR
jgi:hypothetical protein